MSIRLPEPTMFTDTKQRDFMNQLLRVLRNSLGDQEKDIQINLADVEESTSDLQTQINDLSEDKDRGDITTSDDFDTWTIDNSVVTFAKIQDIAQDKLLGRSTASTGPIELIDLSPYGRSLIDDVDASTARSTLGLGTVATAALIDDDTMATATATNVPSAESVKTYVDNSNPIAAAHYTYTVSAGTNGPTYTSGAFRTVPINTENSDPKSIGTLSSNQITLGAGTYTIQAWTNVQAATSNVGTKTRIRDITNSTTLVIGPSAFQSSNQSADANPPLLGMFTLSGSTAIEFQIRPSVNTTAITAPNLGESEVYTQILITKVA